MRDMRRPIESGCPDGMQYMHPVMIRNFGQWKYHEHPRPGVLLHTGAHSGDAIWTVRAGTQRILDVYTLRKLCDIGDEFRRWPCPFHHPQQYRIHGRQTKSKVEP